MIDVIIGYAAYIIPAIVIVVLAVVVLLWIMSLRVVGPTNMVSSTGGVNMAGMIEGLSQTETGKALVNSFISRLGGKTE